MIGQCALGEEEQRICSRNERRTGDWRCGLTSWKRRSQGLLPWRSLRWAFVNSPYKIVSNHVVAFGPDGKELGVVFETVTPFATPLEMQSLVTTMNTAIDERPVHPMIAIGAFVVRFLAIHPFQDGNGRVFRVLTTLLLSEWNPWLAFFLRTLKKQKDRLEAKMKREKLLAEVLPELSVRVLGLLAEHERLSITDIERLTEANRNTLKVRLRELVAEGHIVRHGQARGTWYNRS